MAMDSKTPFWLHTTDQEDEYKRILGGSVRINNQDIPVKVVFNDTDVKVPRLIIRCPHPDFVNKHMHQLPYDYLLFFQTVLLPCISQVAIEHFGIKLVNFRSEGNVALRYNSNEPITPHWHIVFRGIPKVIDNATHNYPYCDPFNGNDYPLATDKLHINNQTLITKDYLKSYSSHFSMHLFESIDNYIKMHNLSVDISNLKKYL